MIDKLKEIPVLKVKYLPLGGFVLMIVFYCFGQPSKLPENKERRKAKLIFSDDFDSFDTTKWIAEIENLPGSSVFVQNKHLFLNTKGGVTVWFNQSLKGNLQIEFTRKVIVKGGKNDRLSDLNQFWMASDPVKGTPFGRDGKFESYDGLQLYYVGMGGNTNTTTRFRKYKGGERVLLKEYLDPAHLLKPNIEYHIKIVIKDDSTKFWVNDELYFSYKDPETLREGYFGFRSTFSNQKIDDFKVYQLE